MRTLIITVVAILLCSIGFAGEWSMQNRCSSFEECMDNVKRTGSSNGGFYEQSVLTAIAFKLDSIEKKLDKPNKECRVDIGSGKDCISRKGEWNCIATLELHDPDDRPCVATK